MPRPSRAPDDQPPHTRQFHVSLVQKQQLDDLDFQSRRRVGDFMNQRVGRRCRQSETVHLETEFFRADKKNVLRRKMWRGEMHSTNHIVRSCSGPRLFMFIHAEPGRGATHTDGEREISAALWYLYRRHAFHSSLPS